MTDPIRVKNKTYFIRVIIFFTNDLITMYVFKYEIMILSCKHEFHSHTKKV